MIQRREAPISPLPSIILAHSFPVIFPSGKGDFFTDEAADASVWKEKARCDLHAEEVPAQTPPSGGNAAACVLPCLPLMGGQPQRQHTFLN